MTLDHDRAETDLANAIRLLHLHLARMEALVGLDLPKSDKERLIRTANIYSSEASGLMIMSRRIEQRLPRMV